jgi:hypothetical protein
VTVQPAPPATTALTKSTPGTHSYNPRQHQVYLAVPGGCHAADRQMTDAEYEAWDANQAEP